MDFFDAHLHQDVLNIVKDSLLIFQTAVDLVRTPPERRIQTLFLKRKILV